MNTEPLTQFIEWTAALILETEEAMERVEYESDNWNALHDRAFWADQARHNARILARELGVEHSRLGPMVITPERAEALRQLWPEDGS